VSLAAQDGCSHNIGRHDFAGCGLRRLVRNYLQMGDRQAHLRQAAGDARRHPRQVNAGNDYLDRPVSGRPRGDDDQRLVIKLAQQPQVLGHLLGRKVAEIAVRIPHAGKVGFHNAVVDRPTQVQDLADNLRIDRRPAPPDSFDDRFQGHGKGPRSIARPRQARRG
jgi:hypothetical protein